MYQGERVLRDRRCSLLYTRRSKNAYLSSYSEVQFTQIQSTVLKDRGMTCKIYVAFTTTVTENHLIAIFTLYALHCSHVLRVSIVFSLYSHKLFVFFMCFCHIFVWF